ncbi:MAG: 4Fe-4S binding protein [Lachnospiraceae bacterium]|nr:4Fe-4S binding protein [Lachnospiraceae bacterium]
MAKKYALIKKENCVACGACQNECPKEAVAVWKGCYAKTDLERCVGCGRCAKVCPAAAISIEKREVQA